MKNTVAEILKKVLEGIDVGGEQSRQFASEIRLLKQALRIGSGLSIRNLTTRLDHGYFVVAGRNTTDPSRDAPYEAWLYKGELDFTTAVPIAFGSGETVLDAISSLEVEIKQLKQERKVHEKVQGLDRTRRDR
jgi:hypothetical protein